MVRKIKAKLVLQLRNQGLSGRSIASAQGIARNSIQAVLDAADRLGVVWDDVAELSEAEVYAAVFPAAAFMRASSRSRTGPGFTLSWPGSG